MVQTTLPVSSSSSCVPTELRSKGVIAYLLSSSEEVSLQSHSRRPLRIQMRTPTPLSLAAAAVTVFLLLLLTTTMEVEAIRLDAESHAAVNQHQQLNVANKSSQNDLMQKDAAGGERSSAAGESETKKSVAVAVAVSVAGQELVKATAHKLPEFHEDYYGASVHEPRHH